jgi:hypothetical protein
VIPISSSSKKGDPKRILAFLNTYGPLSEESEKGIAEALEKGRKNAMPKKLSFA